VLVEELKVAAPVKDVKEVLVPAWSEQIGAEARPSTDHLPKFGRRSYRLKKTRFTSSGVIRWA
jgi:hypothetical protein